MGFVKELRLCGWNYTIRVNDLVFDGTPKNAMVRDGSASMHPSEARELATALIEAAKHAEDAQEKYDTELKNRARVPRETS